MDCISTASLATGVQLNVLEVPDDSLNEHAICAGDMLVLVELDSTELSDLVALYAGAGSNCKHRAVVMRRHGKLAESASLKVQPVELFLRHR